MIDTDIIEKYTHIINDILEEKSITEDDWEFFYDHLEEMAAYRIDNKIELIDEELNYLAFESPKEVDLCSYPYCYSYFNYKKIIELQNKYYAIEYRGGIGKHDEIGYDIEQPYRVQRIERWISISEWEAFDEVSTD